jgi:hypothetical protein
MEPHLRLAAVILAEIEFELQHREHVAALEALQMAVLKQAHVIDAPLSTDLAADEVRIKALHQQQQAELQATQAQLAASDARIRDLQKQLHNTVDDREPSQSDDNWVCVMQ